MLPTLTHRHMNTCIRHPNTHTNVFSSLPLVQDLLVASLAQRRLTTQNWAGPVRQACFPPSRLTASELLSSSLRQSPIASLPVCTEGFAFGQLVLPSALCRAPLPQLCEQPVLLVLNGFLIEHVSLLTNLSANFKEQFHCCWHPPPPRSASPCSLSPAPDILDTFLFIGISSVFFLYFSRTKAVLEWGLCLMKSLYCPQSLECLTYTICSINICWIVAHVCQKLFKPLRQGWSIWLYGGGLYFEGTRHSLGIMYYVPVVSISKESKSESSL